MKKEREGGGSKKTDEQNLDEPQRKEGEDCEKTKDGTQNPKKSAL